MQEEIMNGIQSAPQCANFHAALIYFVERGTYVSPSKPSTNRVPMDKAVVLGTTAVAPRGAHT